MCSQRRFIVLVLKILQRWRLNYGKRLRNSGQRLTIGGHDIRYSFTAISSLTFLVTHIFYDFELWNGTGFVSLLKDTVHPSTLVKNSVFFIVFWLHLSFVVVRKCSFDHFKKTVSREKYCVLHFCNPMSESYDFSTTSSHCIGLEQHLMWKTSYFLHDIVPLT